MHKQQKQASTAIYCTFIKGEHTWNTCYHGALQELPWFHQPHLTESSAGKQLQLSTFIDSTIGMTLERVDPTPYLCSTALTTQPRTTYTLSMCTHAAPCRCTRMHINGNRRAPALLWISSSHFINFSSRRSFKSRPNKTLWFMRGGQVNPTQASQVACKTSIHILIFFSRSRPPQTQSLHLQPHFPALCSLNLYITYSLFLFTCGARKKRHSWLPLVASWGEY